MAVSSWADGALLSVRASQYWWINWQIGETSDPFTKTDSQTIEFRIQVPAGQEKTVTYKVHYTW